MSRPDISFPMETIEQDAISEAIETLGYLSPNAFDSVKDMLKDSMRLGPRAVATAHRKNGRQISDEAKKVLGIRRNAFMSEKALSELTEKGRSKPLHAHFATVWRASFTISRANKIHAYNEHSLKFRHDCTLRYRGVHSEGCSHCDQTRGQIIPMSEASPFPPKECPNEGCCMGFEIHIDYAAHFKRGL
ncbi:hypothetical protein SAMN04488032_107119 [Pacificibacter marinus]|uniref:Phage Mu protein F like protein n=1 Tax=Pacificibacter marinus TaxID=658057 RepID=A0A1Y5T152_9RHOB|nr:hypothetical protein SAMN04488032_107119 [Pacificibacter marinus]SLN49691.1 hypothetical protein PAM7971_02440 [Pacificibacter marinus]